MLREPRPFCSQEHDHGRREQGDEEPAHEGIVDAALNPGPAFADIESMIPMLAAAYLMFWISLVRALLVRAEVVAPLCPRCGLKYERRQLGERICTCGR